MAENKAGIRFTPSHYVEVNLDPSARTVTEEVDGVKTVYEIGKSEKKLLYTNPDISVVMTGDQLFLESEIEGYKYLSFTVTDTSNSFEVEELCEIAPLKSHSGQFVVSQPLDGELWYRKVYRSSGKVLPSTKVYKVGATTENKNACIIKNVYAVK